MVQHGGRREKKTVRGLHEKNHLKCTTISKFYVKNLHLQGLLMKKLHGTVSHYHKAASVKFVVSSTLSDYCNRTWQ